MRRIAPVALLTAAILFLGLFGKHLGLDGLIASGLAPGSLAPAATPHVLLSDLRIEGRGHQPDAVVGNGGWVVLSGGYLVPDATVTPDVQLSLERAVGDGTWRSVDADVSIDFNTGYIVRTPAWSTGAASAVVHYRVVSDGIGGVTRSTPVRVTYENQAFYRGIEAAVYEDAKAYCPSTAVRTEVLKDDAVGEYLTGSQLLLVDPTLAAAGRTRDDDIRTVALHECSHERQWMNYGGTDRGRLEMQRSADAIFAGFRKPAGVVAAYDYWLPRSGTIPTIEHAADCGAQALNPGGYMGYGGWCSRAQLDAGRRLLLGGKY